MLNIIDLMEVIVYARDMDAMVRFYRDTLGLTVAYPVDLDDYSEQFWVTFATGSCTLALHGGGQPDKRGQFVPKYTFRVADVAAARTTLQQHGVTVSDIREPAPGIRVCDAYDPEDNAFSLESALH